MTLEDVYTDLQELGVEALDVNITNYSHFKPLVESGSTSEVLKLERDLFLRVMIQTQSGKVFGFNVCSDSKTADMLRCYLWPKGLKSGALCNELDASKKHRYADLDQTTLTLGKVISELDVCEWPLVLQIIRRMKT